MAEFDRRRVAREFSTAVNMTVAELRRWLESDESRSVGFRRRADSESVGHASGRRIVEILARPESARSEGDYAHMRKVVGFVRRHRAQTPENMYTSRWRYSLMNWGHDPIKEKEVKGFCDDIEDLTEENEDFRRVLYTGAHMQLVVMTLQPGEEIGEEVHPDRDQFFRIEEGEGVILIDGQENRVEDDIAVFVPAGARHNVRNTGDEPLRFYTIYGPPEHKDGIVHRTKQEAEERHHEEEWDGATTE